MFRTSILALGCMAAATSLAAQQPMLNAAPSTRATAVVTLAPPRGTEGVAPAYIRIDYGQPHLRGRKLHTDNLVPLDSVWRLGANESTTLETDVDLVVGGRPVPKGKYSLHALPTAAGWKLIINSDTSAGYNAARDLTRVDLNKRTLAAPVESLSMWLIPSREPGSPSGELRFAWGDAELSTTWAMRTTP